ncbi:hypothetical protein, partial [Marivita sp.]|uniref:hypothetical protein n=1 Tax=Marivita sp. TaxID=2003365 RepID=UPI0025BA90D1
TQRQTTRPVRPNFTARPPSYTPELSTTVSNQRPVRCPNIRLSAAGEEVFRVRAAGPQEEKSENLKIRQIYSKPLSLNLFIHHKPEKLSLVCYGHDVM